MTIRKMVPITYLLAVSGFCVLVYLRSQQSSNLMALLPLFLGTQYLFAFTALAEINRSASSLLTEKEKFNWRIYLLMAPLVFGVIYLKTIRKRVLQSEIL